MKRKVIFLSNFCNDNAVIEEYSFPKEEGEGTGRGVKWDASNRMVVSFHFSLFSYSSFVFSLYPGQIILLKDFAGAKRVEERNLY